MKSLLSLQTLWWCHSVLWLSLPQQPPPAVPGSPSPILYKISWNGPGKRARVVCDSEISRQSQAAKWDLCSLEEETFPLQSAIPARSWLCPFHSSARLPWIFYEHFIRISGSLSPARSEIFQVWFYGVLQKWEYSVHGLKFRNCIFNGAFLRWVKFTLMLFLDFIFSSELF